MSTSELMSLPPTAAGMNSSLTSSSSTTLQGNFTTTNSHSYIPMVLAILFLLTAAGFLSACLRRSSAAVPRSLEPSAVNSLPVVAYSQQQHMIEECAICLSEFQGRDSVKLIPYCGHVFHSACIDTWLSSHVTCPLCRSSYLFKEEQPPS